MGNCQSCDCKDTKEIETKELNYERNSVGHTTAQASPAVKTYNKEAVRFIQAVWRGYLVRKAASHLLKQTVPNHSYFTAQDSRETLSRLSSPSRVRSRRAVYRFKSAATYTGEWLGGFRDGFGEMVWADGARYSGNWSYGKPFGQGQFRHVDGEIYDGNWSHCRVKPRDVFFTNGNLRVSEPIEDGYVWLVCKQEELKRRPKASGVNAFGKLLVESKLSELMTKQQQLEETLQAPKLKFAGTLEPSELLQTGQREFRQQRYKNGNIYLGEWLHNKRDGHGKHIWSNGDVYSGEWKDDMQDGWGKSTWVDGSCYTGSYKRNIKEGTGEYHWKDNSKYAGEWKANEMDGHGEYCWTDGRKYIGSWVRSKMEGYGVFFWTDGRRYEGLWKNSLKHGEGVMHSADGKVSQETWSMGKLVTSDKSIV